MTIFAVVGTANLSALDASIMAKYEGQFFKLTANHWFVFDRVTSKEVSDKLGITDATGGQGVVLNVVGYWGNTNKQLWEWLASREGVPGA